MGDTYTIKTAKSKAAKYCAYQERTQQEVRDKLYKWGLYGDEVEEVIVFLISENFVNEERYAIAYALGHFKQNKWGKLKIKAGLKQKHISDYCINKGLKEIKLDMYEEVIQQLLVKKYEQQSGDTAFVRKNKSVRYLLQKGFEQSLVWEHANLLFE